MFDLSQIKLHKQRTMGHKYVKNTRIQAAEQAWYTCTRQTYLIWLAKRTEPSPIENESKRNVLICLVECLMAFKFYQTQSNCTKQGWSNGKMVGHQTMFDVYGENSKAANATGCI